ncbi:hypothetical protein ILYODFUR_019310 [Ilyodon furcidens]|uniref:Uncharacterized protein n=1 Tax=Ilyodon furcidens TaxID=33524 RepID=A0ABV0VFE0_9TELE
MAIVYVKGKLKHNRLELLLCLGESGGLHLYLWELFIFEKKKFIQKMVGIHLSISVEKSEESVRINAVKTTSLWMKQNVENISSSRQTKGKHQLFFVYVFLSLSLCQGILLLCI